MESLLLPVRQFLCCATPAAWIELARQPEHQAVILQDHLLCELKAAQSAAWLLRRYVLDESSSQRLHACLAPYSATVYQPQRLARLPRPELSLSELTLRQGSSWSRALLDKMVRLIKEELHHFNQVHSLMQSRGIAVRPLSASRYAAGLLNEVRTFEPQALVDKLIIGAYIEARSCERFAALAPHLDGELQRFYLSLLRSEARHFQDYLTLAQLISPEPIEPRIEIIGAQERRLIESADVQFRFHSGVPIPSRSPAAPVQQSS
ncbi:tRNA-(ms[2]io[6]A)-hydroxylase [Ferrimonas sediminum]|uniref:tRNA-(Ms[2]io[6]A)-hydroxylase n=1 Tax=Ferrimonas sediminum TaxID=718193 RepID=A0A1G8RD42_9GAMM|nr:tRNA isopentenyl-2-thiomethyl-A-37 hydroxylase MiaE [Ferrimonas sediminum]SDJ14964.1 tRNA-(ms[2]io[6]A)-hydroxylase [Ferrimonas sediminum]